MVLCSDTRFVCASILMTVIILTSSIFMRLALLPSGVFYAEGFFESTKMLRLFKILMDMLNYIANYIQALLDFEYLRENLKLICNRYSGNFFLAVNQELILDNKMI
jgi:hypothetical protein